MCNQQVHPLPDYASGQYFIRIGPNGVVNDQYAYSGYFPYVGNGTALPDGETAATAATTTAAAANTVLQILINILLLRPTTHQFFFHNCTNYYFLYTFTTLDSLHP